MARKRKNGLFGFLTEKKVTYKRDVKKERKQLVREAKQAKREQERAELAEIKASERAERKRKADRKRADDVDRQIEREMREQGLRNPSISKLKKGVRGTVRLLGKGKSLRLEVYT